jgi:hypothetical protein
MKERLKKVLGRGKLALLAVVLALTVGTASTALAANGGNFILGVLTNDATAITKLTANIPNNTLHLANTSTSAGATALRLQTDASMPPMRVDSGTKVTNLNVDKLDGKDSSDFMPAQVYEREQATWVSASSTGNIFPACDAGDVAISGGYRDLDFTSRVIRDERYAADPKYWALAIRNTASTADAITVEVVCINLA